MKKMFSYKVNTTLLFDATFASNDEFKAMCREYFLIRFLHSPILIALCLFTLATANYAMIDTMSYGEVQTFTYAKQFVDPNYLPDDWFLSIKQSVRIPYQILVYPLVKFLPLSTASLVARLMGYLLISVSIALIAYRLRINALFVSIAMGIYFYVGQSLLPGLEWMVDSAESKVIAYGLVILALFFVSVRRLKTAGALLGLATTLHLLVGGWSTLVMILTVLNCRLCRWREFLWFGITGLAVGSYILYSTLVRLLQPKPISGINFPELWVYFRNPHYVDLSFWDINEYETVVFLFLIMVLWKVSALYPGRQGYFIVSRFALFTLVPYLLGVLVQPFGFSPTFLQFLPFRIADTLIPLFGFLIIIPIFFKTDSFLKLRFPIVISLLAISVDLAWQGVERGLYQHSKYPAGAYISSSRETMVFHKVCQWIKSNTKPKSRIIASPDINIIPYLCQRPVVVSFRDVPTTLTDFTEWYSRLKAFNGGEIPASRGYSASYEIDLNFRRLSEYQYLNLGRRYDAAYLLVKRSDALQLPLLFKHKNWSFYQLN